MLYGVEWVNNEYGKDEIYPITNGNGSDIIKAVNLLNDELQ